MLIEIYGILLLLINGNTYPRNVSQVEQVVYLGWCWKHFNDNGVVDVNGGLREKQKGKHRHAMVNLCIET